MSRVVWDYSSNSGILFLKNIKCGGNDTSKAKYWCLVFLMQRKPIANKYRKGMMKRTLQARMLTY